VDGAVVAVGRSVMKGGVKLEGVGSKEGRRSGEVVACVIRRLFCREAALLLGLGEEWGLAGGLALVSRW